MKVRKSLALMTSAVLSVAMLAGCGQDNATGGNAESIVTQSSEENSEAAGAETVVDEVEPSTDPMGMITEGYYSYTYPVEGMDDMCAFFHFYEEQPVLGSVFYAGYAWNQITYVGTYTVEEKESSYACVANREDQSAEPRKLTEGTAPYTVTFYGFDGTELGSCGFDGEILYNDSAIAGTGAEDCMFYHDVDPESAYMSTYEGEAGVAYLDFVAEDPTSTLTLFHNGRYMDMVGMIIEGAWTMAEGTDGYEYTLTPDSASDTPAVVMVAADEQTCTYTPDGGEAVPMTNTRTAGPAARMLLQGETPIPGQEVKADVLGSLFEDGTVKLMVSAFGTEMDLDAGTWTMGEDGYTITFQFDNAGELVSGLGEAGAMLRYVGTSEMLGEIDTELVVSIAE